MNKGHAPVKPDTHAYNIILWMFYEIKEFRKAHTVL